MLLTITFCIADHMITLSSPFPFPFLGAQAYGSQFVQKVYHRHVLARNYFSRVPGMMDKMEEKVTELPLPRPKERVLTVPWRNGNRSDETGNETLTPVVEAV